MHLYLIVAALQLHWPGGQGNSFDVHKASRDPKRATAMAEFMAFHGFLGFQLGTH
jgi:hypothetical protein